MSEVMIVLTWWVGSGGGVSGREFRGSEVVLVVVIVLM